MKQNLRNLFYILFLILDIAYARNPFLINNKLVSILPAVPQFESTKAKFAMPINEDLPLDLEFIRLNHTKADELIQLLKNQGASWLSLRGSMGVDVRSNAIWINDIKANIIKLKDLVKKYDIPLNQVLIETRIVTVSREVASDIGINWKLKHPSFNNPNDNERDSGKNLAQQLSFDLPLEAAVEKAATINIAYLGAQILLDLELSALENEHKAKIIASPSVVTGQLEEAYISSGQQIPYQEATASGATSTSFRQAALSLKVTPRIMPNKKVMLQLKINQDRPQAMLYNGVPAITTKEISTSILAKSGQTVVLGGIIETHQMQHQISLPFIGSLPIIGNLFRKTQKEAREEELLVFITPTILNN